MRPERTGPEEQSRQENPRNPSKRKREGNQHLLSAYVATGTLHPWILLINYFTQRKQGGTG